MLYPRQSITNNEKYKIEAAYQIERRVGHSLPDLRAVKYHLSKKYASFLPNNIVGKHALSDILWRVRYTDDVHNYNLAEKIWAKNIQIEEMQIKAKNSGAHALVNEIQSVLAYWEVLSTYVLPVDLLWGMEEQKNSGEHFSEVQAKAYKYFKLLGNLYLDETKKIDNYLNANNTEKD